ncbi:MAG: CoA-binding protein [Alphaproteobacteria bacterium]
MTSFKNPPDAELYRILDEAYTIALVGASSNPGRPSHGIMKRLQAAGYKVIPVNPNEHEILGEDVYASLAEIPSAFKIDIVNVFRKSETTPPIAEEASDIGAKTLWLQLGIENEEVAPIASEGGTNLVMNACIAVELARLGVPPKS